MSKVGGLEDGEGEGTESGGSDDEVKEGGLAFRKVSRLAARRTVTARVLSLLGAMMRSRRELACLDS